MYHNHCDVRYNSIVVGRVIFGHMIGCMAIAGGCIVGCVVMFSCGCIGGYIVGCSIGCVGMLVGRVVVWGSFWLCRLPYERLY